MASHYLGQILADLLEMQQRNFLVDGWESGLCFLSHVGTLNREQLTMSPGHLGKKYILNTYPSSTSNAYFSHLIVR